MMDIKELYQIERISDRVAVIFSTTYVNPISYLPMIEKDLSRLNFNGKIIFDLLLSNGYSSNRFIEADVCEAKVNRSSMRVIDSSHLDEFLMRRTYDFYQSNPELVENNSILLDEEKYHLIHT